MVLILNRKRVFVSVGPETGNSPGASFKYGSIGIPEWAFTNEQTTILLRREPLVTVERVLYRKEEQLEREKNEGTISRDPIKRAATIGK